MPPSGPVITDTGLQKVLVLVGPRAAGKTTLGKALARRLDVTFLDGDDLLATEMGMPAARFLREAGEAVFREVETRLTVAALTNPTPAVFALGGGAVLAPEVRMALKPDHLFVVLLIAPPPVLIARISAAPGERPPLTHLPLAEEVQTVLAARLALYQQVADLELETSQENVDACCDRLLARLREVWNSRRPGGRRR